MELLNRDSQIQGSKDGIDNEIRIQVSKLPQITKQRGMPFSGIIIFGSTLLAFLGFGIGMASGEYHTPTHTNSFSLYT